MFFLAKLECENSTGQTLGFETRVCHGTDLSPIPYPLAIRKRESEEEGAGEWGTEKGERDPKDKISVSTPDTSLIVQT